MNEICIKKRKSSYDYNEITDIKINEIQLDLSHNKKNNEIINIPYKLTDEKSFIKWFNFIQITIPISKFQKLININFINENDEKYCEKLKSFNKKCIKYENLNNELNNLIFNSISNEKLINDVEFSFDSFAYCNFERIKIYFQSKINIFYLMNLENELNFDNSNKLKFLNDLDHLYNVYKLIFNELPSKDLKINWILNSINKQKIYQNSEILIDIQNNWESICKDPINLRKLLLKY